MSRTYEQRQTERERAIDEATGRKMAVPCPNCLTPVPDRDEYVVAVNEEGFGRISKCPVCGAFMRHVVPMISAGPPWYWDLLAGQIEWDNGRELEDVLAEARGLKANIERIRAERAGEGG